MSEEIVCDPAAGGRSEFAEPAQAPARIASAHVPSVDLKSRTRHSAKSTIVHPGRASRANRGIGHPKESAAASDVLSGNLDHFLQATPNQLFCVPRDRSDRCPDRPSDPTEAE